MQRRPLMLAVIAVLATSPAFAQQTPAAGDTQRALDNVIVTGTRVTDRTIAESSAPIDVITPEVLEATGTTELATALSRVLPSLNFPRPAITDGTDAVRPAQLRGLAPDQVLVLVNGKRRHTTAMINLNGSQGRGSSPVDLNAIPISAVERIEVLRDGASAQYGSDAIAGVINVVLKGSGNGGSVNARAGGYSEGDGKQWSVGGDAGFDFGKRGFVRFAAQGGHQDQTNRATPFNGVMEQRYGDPEVDSTAFSVNAEYRPAEGVQFYGFANANRRKVLSNGYFRWATDNRNRPEIYPDGFLPQIRNISKDQAVVLGLRGKIGESWDLDFSYNYGANRLSFDILNTLNNSLGVTSPRQFYAGALEVDQHLLNLDLRRPVDIGLEYPMTLALGAEWRGEQFRQSQGETGSWINGGVASANGSLLPGAQVFPGYRPGDAGRFDRRSLSLYADAEADIGEHLTLGAAVRGEKYSDFGNTTSGKLSGRYAFGDVAALRGTWSTGFRAPSLQQQFFQSTSTSFINVAGSSVPFEIRTFRVNDPAAMALGAEALKAEKSKNLSLGLVLTPVRDLYITLDAYRIDVDDRIILSENLISAAVRNYLQSVGYLGVGGGRYFTNAVDTRTDGIDLVASYQWKLASGSVDFNLGYNRNKTRVRGIAPNPAALTAIDPTAVRVGRVEIGRITEGSPRDKFNLGANWRVQGFSLGANATRWGEFTGFGTTPASDQTYAAKWTLDLSAGYRLGGWNFTVGSDNVFDTYPDRSLAGAGTRSYLPYSTQSPFGFNGRYVYANIGYTW